MKRGIVILIASIFIILLINQVSALNACCELTTDGQYCQYTDELQCDPNARSTYATCEQTSYCQMGCCYSSDSGICYKNTPKSRCEAEPGATWTSSQNCDIDQCTLGCCTLADQAFFVTEVKCKQTASLYEDVEMSFNLDINTEYDCLNSVKNQEFGCCVEENSYTFTTRDSCLTATAEPTTNFTIPGFHEGMLCSNDLLASDCAKQQYTSCYQGKVYWYDSCGNRENIYSSDKTTSYNNGYILDEELSCTVTGPNDPNCGNCDYATGNVCGEDENNRMPFGDFTCEDINCYNTYEDEISELSGGNKLNGESWCIYDSDPGAGQDKVGSRHFKHICINGEEIVEPCADFRDEICINGILSKDVLGTLEALRLSDDENYIEAACRENRNEDCNDCNEYTKDCSACNNFLGINGKVTDEFIDCCSSIAQTLAQECCENEDQRDCFWLEGKLQSVNRDIKTKQQERVEELELELNVAGVCIPQVPSGQKFWTDNGDGTSTSDNICSVASTECKATWRIGGFKKFLGQKKNPESWDLVEESPPGCTDRSWLISQNVLCKSQGDCGAYLNFNDKSSRDGFSTNLFDEKFFFEHKELTDKELEEWGYFINIGDEEIKYKGFRSRYWYENPATYIGAVGSLTGSILNVASCKQSKKAGVESKYLALDGAGAETLLGGAGKLGGLAERLGGLPIGDVISIDSITGNAISIYTGSSACLAQGYDIKIDEVTGYENTPFKCIQEKEGHISTCNIDTGTISILEYEVTDACTKTGIDPKCKFSRCLEGKCVDYATYCATLTDSTDPACNEEIADKLSEAAKAKTEPLSFAEGAGCAVSGALPIVGLFGDATGKWKVSDIGKLLGSGSEIEQNLGQTLQKAAGLKTGSRVANVATIAMVGYLLIEYLNENETTITYNVDCNLWQPPKGGDDCELCNQENKPCSEYRCRSLGAACELINQGSENETCVSIGGNDVNSPIITLNNELLSENITVQETFEESNKGYIINELIPAFTPIQLGISTDEPAQCKYSAQPGNNYEELTYNFGSNLYTYNHSLLFSLGDEVTQEEVLALTQGIYTLYIKCSDYNGNTNERDFFIRFQVDTTPDLTPPEVVYTSLAEGTHLSYGVNVTSFSLYTNEPAQCRWDTEDASYDIMNYEMECSQSELAQLSQYFGTYPCKADLEGVSNENINYFYFKCKDRVGNTNEESFRFSTKSSEDNLYITSLEPTGTIYNDTINIEVTTEGGAQNGVALCAISTETNIFSEMPLFLETNSTYHEQELNLFKGEYTLYVTCQDRAGNQATNSSQIEIDIDTKSPSLINFYIDEIFQELVFETSENTLCEFGTQPFTFGEGSDIGGEYTPTHSISIGSPVYYIICEDEFNNQGSYIIDISLWQ